MSASVLSVGQCSPDHHGIQSIIEHNFDAQLEAADSIGEALNLMSPPDVTTSSL